MSAVRNFYRAVIFDMDGVLVDSEPAFFDAINEVLAEEGRSVEFEPYRRLLGTSVEVAWRELIEMLDLRGNLEDYLRRYDAVLLDCLRCPRPPLPGVIELLEELDYRSVMIALATSSLRSWSDAVLESAGLQDRFRTIVTADGVENKKPAPDLYLKAAALLCTPPGDCIAVEDTQPGIASAKAAGMYAVQVRSCSTACPPIEEADLVLESLEHFPLSVVRGD